MKDILARLAALTVKDENGLLPCTVCGAATYTSWHGKGTQAGLWCNECGQTIEIQVSDLFEDGKTFPFDMKTMRYPDEAIERAKTKLIELWNNERPRESALIALVQEAAEQCIGRT